MFWELQQETKQEMIHKISGDIPSSDITAITFSKEEISASDFREKDELEYKGSMYDVVKKSETNDSYIFYCINDIKEAHLIKNFKQHFDDNKEKSNQNNLKTLISLIAPAVIVNNNIVNRTDIVSSLNNHLSFNYKSIWFDKLTPPPKS